ncbi:MAG: DUF4328 domain-containing protein [Bacteroidales bacterium]|nr:DUF4328 domain-containing protein [Bacteroidales bacterium]
MTELKSSKKRARTAILMIWVVLINRLIFIPFAFLQFVFIFGLYQGVDYEKLYYFNLISTLIINSSLLLTWIISAITFILWFQRAYANLHRKINYLNYEPYWASLGWFVPVLNLIRPYQIMNELTTETKDWIEKHHLNVTEKYNTKYPAIWWGIWLVIISIDFLIYLMFYQLHSMSSTGFLSYSFLINLLYIPLSILIIRIIHQHTEAEPLLNQITEND